jgi:hypothetical protein
MTDRPGSARWLILPAAVRGLTVVVFVALLVVSLVRHELLASVILALLLTVNVLWFAMYVRRLRR